MRYLLTILTIALLAGIATADPVVVNFDDLEGFGPIEPGYGGIMAWNNWAHTTGDASYPPLSGPNIAINVGAATPIEFGQDVNLIGFSFTGPNAGIFPVHFKLMLAGEVVFEIEEFHTNAEPGIWEVPYEGVIDAMIMDQIPGTPYGFFCIDDLTYEAASVPVEAVSLSGVKALFE